MPQSASDIAMYGNRDAANAANAAMQAADAAFAAQNSHGQATAEQRAAYAAAQAQFAGTPLASGTANPQDAGLTQGQAQARLQATPDNRGLNGFTGTTNPNGVGVPGGAPITTPTSDPTSGVATPPAGSMSMADIQAGQTANPPQYNEQGMQTNLPSNTSPASTGAVSTGAGTADPNASAPVNNLPGQVNAISNSMAGNPVSASTTGTAPASTLTAPTLTNPTMNSPTYTPPPTVAPVSGGPSLMPQLPTYSPPTGGGLPGYDFNKLLGQVTQYEQASPQETALQQQITALNASMMAGENQSMAEPIPYSVKSGTANNIQNQVNAQEQTLTQQLAALQAQRQQQYQSALDTLNASSGQNQQLQQRADAQALQVYNSALQDAQLQYQAATAQQNRGDNLTAAAQQRADQQALDQYNAAVAAAQQNYTQQQNANALAQQNFQNQMTVQGNQQGQQQQQFANQLALQQANKPINVPAGDLSINPVTGQPVASNPTTAQQNAIGLDLNIGTRPSPSNPNTTEYFNTQTGQGFSTPQALANYYNQTTGTAKATAANVFDLLKGSSSTTAPKTVKVGKATYQWDANSGKYVPITGSPPTGGGGGTTTAPGKNGAPPQGAINNMQTDLTAVQGADGGISPADWNNNLKKWTSAGYSQASFIKSFGYLAKNSAKNYNPNVGGAGNGTPLSAYQGM